MVTVSLWPRTPAQREVAMKVVAGIRRHDDMILISDHTQADIGITWGVRNRAPFKACQHVLVMERAYLGDRFEWISLGWDGLNGKANFCNADVPDDRWTKYWRDEMREPSGGRGALIIGQVTGDMATVGVNLNTWAKEVSQGLTDLGVEHVYRPHPESVRKGQRQPMRADKRPLEQALAECDSVITYNSNVGVLAAMAGKRVTVENDGAMAFEVAGHGWKNDQDLGDRDDWGRKLAYCQWLPEEIEAGEFWPTLRRIFG